MSTREPTQFPPNWAEAWGDDGYGLWAEFVVGAARQRMRWIEPGEFWMGAPDGDLQRHDDETPKHRVRISRGFWMADAACTQALWVALMGRNPSYFDDEPLCPVEWVGWEDVQIFLSKLAAAGVTGQPSLPTEAEWEYACRSGTETAFHFGDQISPRWSNYDGNYPYNNGAKGVNRACTVPVKALPANAWGLFQMHGNVFEWCADGPRRYAVKLTVDPEGPRGARDSRVVRGGSWFYGAWYCRASSRMECEPGNRNDGLGFRLVLRS